MLSTQALSSDKDDAVQDGHYLRADTELFKQDELVLGEKIRKSVTAALWRVHQNMLHIVHSETDGTIDFTQCYLVFRSQSSQ